MRFSLALLYLAMTAAPAVAQTGVSPPQGWSLGLFLGGSAYTDFQRATVRAVRLDAEGLPEFQEFPRRLGAQTSPLFAAFVSYWPSANWGLRLHSTYAPSRFKTVIPQSGADFLGEPRSSQDSAKLSELAISTYQLQAVFRLPTIRHRVMPYGIVGGGVSRFSKTGSEPLPADALGDFSGGARTSGSGSVGLGAAINMRRPGWRLHFELTDHISRTPVRESADVVIGETAELAGEPARPVKLVNALSFSVGISLGPR